MEFMLRGWRLSVLLVLALGAPLAEANSMGTNAADTILVYGDSVSAAYGLRPREGWPTLLEERLRARKFNYIVANASISGETSAGGAARIDAALARTKPSIVIVALGANDGLRGLPVAQMKTNLARIVGAAQARGAKVLIVGMRVPPNYGREYSQAFFAAFSDLARARHAAYVPFLFEGFAERRDYYQDDNMHPNARAQSIMLDNVWRGLEPLLRRN